MANIAYKTHHLLNVRENQNIDDRTNLKNFNFPANWTKYHNARHCQFL